MEKEKIAFEKGLRELTGDRYTEVALLLHKYCLYKEKAKQEIEYYINDELTKMRLIRAFGL